MRCPHGVSFATIAVTAPRPHLGALALLAQLPPDAVRANTDVTAVARLAGNPDDLETLDLYCATGSVRRAADLLHLHHSSVARRLEQIGKLLDLELTHPSGLTRARLTSWRLLDDGGSPAAR